MSTPKTAAPSRRGPIIAIIVAAVLGALLVSVVLAGKKKDPAKVTGGIAQVHPVTVTGTALPKLDSTAATDPAGTAT